MSGVNKFAGEGQGKNHHVVIDKEKSSTISEEKVEPSEKVTPSESVVFVIKLTTSLARSALNYD